MTTQFHFFGLNANRRVKEMVRVCLEQLRRHASIRSAVVVLDRKRNGGPPFTMRVHLAVPGPDIHAEARDHTLQAAWRKLRKNLEQQIDARTCRQEARAVRPDRQRLSVKRDFAGFAARRAEDFFLRSARPGRNTKKTTKRRDQHEKQRQRT